MRMRVASIPFQKLRYEIRTREIEMASGSGPTSFQTHLERFAASVGYKEKIRGLPKEASGNIKVAHFLKWLEEQLVTSNTLSQFELERFEEVKKTGVILEGTELREAMGKVECCSEDRPIDELRAEVSSLQHTVSSLKAQLQSLNNIQNTLSAHQKGLLKEKESARLTHSNTLTSYQTSLHTAQTDNTKVNSALNDLQSALDNANTFYQQPSHIKDGVDGIPESSLLSHRPSHNYTLAEDHYLTELTAYTKKQFFQGIAVMAHTPPSMEDNAGVVDLSDPANILMRGSSSQQYSTQCQELTRLKELYPVVEAQRVSDMLAQQYAEAVCKRAKEVVNELQQRPSLDANVLRQNIKEKQTRLVELHTQTNQLAQHQLPGLIQEMATLEVSTVLHGDYNLKIARQDYFTSKQDKVISQLLQQTSRQELLSMLYEVELRRHRDTHRLLTAASSQLHSWRETANKRAQAMQNTSLLPVKETRKTIDSRDLFATRMCSMLGVSASGSAHLLSHDSLENAVGQLVQQTASLEALVSALESEQQQTLQEVVTMSEVLGKQVFGNGSGNPQLTVKEYEEECSKLESLLSTMEQNIKKLLSDFDSKKKCLQGNELLQRERKLFVYFFTDPKQLIREVAELSRRIDTITTAKQTF